jgi:hypothetical protein
LRFKAFDLQQIGHVYYPLIKFRTFLILTLFMGKSRLIKTGVQEKIGILSKFCVGTILKV